MINSRSDHQEIDLLFLNHLVITKLDSPKCRREDNIKIDYTEIDFAITKWFDITQQMW
jgi:hypothetical protein